MFKRWRRNRRLGKIKPGNGSALPRYRWHQLLSRSIFFRELEERDGAHTYAVDVRYFEDELSGQKGDRTWDGSVRKTDEAGDGEKSISETVSGWFSDDGSGSEWSDWLGGDLFGDGKEKRGGAVAAGDSPVEEEAPLQSGPPAAANDRKPGKAPAALYRDGVQLYRSKLPATFPVPGGVIEVAASVYGASRMHFVGEDGREQTLVPHRRTAEGLRARFGKRFPAMSKAIGALAILVLLVGLVVGIPQGIEMVTSIEPIAERVGTFTSPIQLPAWANISLLVAGILAAMERALTLRNHWLIDFDTTWTAFG